MRVLKEALRELSPKKRISVTTASLNSKMPQVILLIMPKRVIISFA